MSAPDYKALFEAEQRRREQAEVEAAELRTLARNTTLPEYLDFCHTYPFQTPTVPANKQLTTRGNTITGIKCGTHPHFIRPWADFQKIQDSTWKRLRHVYPPAGPRAFDPLVHLESCGNSISKRLLARGLDVAFLQHESVEKPVSNILNYLHTLPDVREEFGLKSTGVDFDNHTNALSDIDDAMRKWAEMADTYSIPALYTLTRTPPGPTKANQICVYTTEVNGRLINHVGFTIEYLPPHKVTLDLLRLALRPDRDVIPTEPHTGWVCIPSSEDELSHSQYSADTAVAEIVTQAYSNMIACSSCFGYITTSEAMVFLYISPNSFPGTVYYHLVEPRGDVETQMTAFPGTEFHLNRTAVGQVLGFSLRALESSFSKSRLTGLPPELRLQILAELELGPLRALVNASSVFYRDYHCNRRFVLTSCLQLTLQDITVDACAVLQSPSVQTGEVWTRDRVTQFLDSYQDQRALAYKSQFTKHLTEEEAIEMADTYWFTIRPLASYYVDWVGAYLRGKFKSFRSYGPLSKTEETRVLRALYRYELFSHLFGESPSRNAKIHNVFPVIDVLKLFLGLFEPWEVEEMVCIHNFTVEKIREILPSLPGDLQWIPNGQEESPPPGMFHNGMSISRRMLDEGALSCGLSLLRRSISNKWDNKRLVEKLRKEMSYTRHRFLVDAWDTSNQSMVNKDPPYSHRQQKEERRDRLVFTGDGDSETDGPRPNLGWVLQCLGTYCNVFGDYEHNYLHNWGYVMWDRGRLNLTHSQYRSYRPDCQVGNLPI
ncbi:MAG: hypothetical protein M1839_002120 [Geoglossum umbratile]|nr:MAG: hypothetical protein M1839_002120 [Geoglossum umbratile]